MVTTQIQNIILNSDLGNVVLSLELKQEIKELVAPYIKTIEQVAQGLTIGIGEKSLVNLLAPALTDKYQHLIREARQRGVTTSFATTVVAHLREVMPSLGYHGQEIGGQVGYAYWKPKIESNRLPT